MEYIEKVTDKKWDKNGKHCYRKKSNNAENSKRTGTRTLLSEILLT